MQRIFGKIFPSDDMARRHLVRFWETDEVAWQPAVRTIMFRNRPTRLSVTPAWKILGLFPPEDGEGAPTGPRLGISPANDGSLHLVNGWLAEVEGSDLPPLHMVRHGHLRHPFRCEDDVTPAAEELLALTVRCQGKLWEKLVAMAARRETSAVPVRLASVQLMTPGTREWFCDGWRPREQHLAWEMAARKEIPIAVRPHPTTSPVQIYLKPEVLIFDFPVNPWFHQLGGVSILGKSPIPEDFFSSNDRSLRVLFGASCAGGEEGPDFWRVPQTLLRDWEIVRSADRMTRVVLIAAQSLWEQSSLVGEVLGAGNRSDRELWQIIQLARQALELCQVTSRAKRGIGWRRRALRGYEDFFFTRNPYAMPARILVLCHLLGLACACNCRSGKDRTGVLHGEVAYLWLSLQEDERGIVPEPCVAKSGPSLRERWERVQILDACGSNHILFSCTGFHGYRVYDDRWWLRTLLRFPFLEAIYGPLIGSSLLSKW